MRERLAISHFSDWPRNPWKIDYFHVREREGKRKRMREERVLLVWAKLPSPSQVQMTCLARTVWFSLSLDWQRWQCLQQPMQCLECMKFWKIKSVHTNVHLLIKITNSVYKGVGGVGGRIHAILWRASWDESMIHCFLLNFLPFVRPKCLIG